MEHIANPELRSFIERLLPPDRLLEIDDHLAACPACRGALEREAQVGRGIAGLQVGFARTPSHLEFEQLLCLAEGRSVSFELEEHVAGCSSCAREVEELRHFVAEIAETPRSVRVVRPVAAWPRVERWRLAPILSGLAAAALLVGAGLYWHASLGTPKSENALASLRDGDYKLSLDKSGQLHGAEGLQPDQQEALQAVLASGRLPAGKPLDFTAGHQETMLGASVAGPLFKVTSPVNRVVIDDRPTFTWEAMPNSTGYRVRVYAAGYRRIVESPLLHATTWQATTSLPRGHAYTWTVTAEYPGGEARAPAPPQPEAAFQVIANETAAELERATRDRGTEHLLLAIIYVRAGAIDEARAQLDLLAEQNPDSRLVGQLRASLNQDAPSPIRKKAAQ